MGKRKTAIKRLKIKGESSLPVEESQPESSFVNDLDKTQEEYVKNAPVEGIKEVIEPPVKAPAKLKKEIIEAVEKAIQEDMEQKSKEADIEFPKSKMNKFIARLKSKLSECLKTSVECSKYLIERKSVIVGKAFEISKKGIMISTKGLKAGAAKSLDFGGKAYDKCMRMSRQSLAISKKGLNIGVKGIHSAVNILGGEVNMIASGVSARSKHASMKCRLEKIRKNIFRNFLKAGEKIYELKNQNAGDILLNAEVKKTLDQIKSHEREIEEIEKKLIDKKKDTAGKIIADANVEENITLIPAAS